MTDPIFIELVQVPHCAIAVETIAVERLFQDPVNQVDHFRQNPCRVPVVTVRADYRLKPRRQKPYVSGFESSRTGRARKQVRKDTSEAQHPDFEVARGELDRTSLFES